MEQAVTLAHDSNADIEVTTNSRLSDVVRRTSFTEIMSKAGIVLLGNIAQAFGIVLTSRVLTEMLLPTQVGGVTQMWSMANLFYMLLAVPVFQYIARGFGEWHDEGSLVGHLVAYFRYSLAITTVAMLIAWGLQSAFGFVSGFDTIWVVALTGLYLFSSTISTLGSTGFNLLNQRGLFVLFSNFPIWVGIVFSYLLFRVFRYPQFWSLGQYAALFLAGLSFFLLVRHLGAARSEASGFSSGLVPFSSSGIYRFAWPLAVTNILGWVQFQSYKFVLDRIGGTANVGLFSIGYSLGGSIMALYESVFNQYYMPIFYQNLKGQETEGQARAWNEFAKAYLPGIVLVGAFVACNARFLAQIMVGEQYRNAAAILVIWAACNESIRAVTSMVSHLSFAKVDTRITLLPLVVGGTLSPLCVFLFGRFDPLHGTAFAFLIAYLGMLVASVRNINRALPISWPLTRIVGAMGLALPLFLLSFGAHLFGVSPTTLNSLFMLSCGGIYVAVMQMFLLKGDDYAVIKRRLKEIPLIFRVNARLKAYRTARDLDGIRKHYEMKARSEGFAYSEDRALEGFQSSISRRGIVPRTCSPGQTRIFWVGANWAQDDSGFLAALHKLGHVYLFRNVTSAYGLLYHGDDGQIHRCAPDVIAKNDACLLNQVQEALRDGPIDLLFGQMWANYISADALRQIQNMGIMTVNISMDDRLPEHWGVHKGVRLGSVGLCKGLDLVLTTSSECCAYYGMEGCAALFWPLASSSDRFFPYPDGEKIYDVSFIGNRYGIRGKIIERLQQAGINVTPFGSGWPNGPVGAEQSAEILGKSRIILGVGNIAYNEDIYTLKLRDFDAPMAGALYITHRNRDLLKLFEEGREIECYETIAECIDKIKYYLAKPEKRSEIAAAGLSKAITSHTWDARLSLLFRQYIFNG